MNHWYGRNGQFLIVLILLATIGTRTVAEEEKNLVANASFEEVAADKPIGWETRVWSGDAEFSVETSFGHTGKSCAKIVSPNGGDASWSFRIKVKPNTDYELTAWIKTNQIDADGFGAQLNLHELQMEGKTSPLRGTNDWRLVRSQFNSGRHKSLLLNCLFGGWGKATGTAWFDDIRVIPISKYDAPPKMSADEAGRFFETSVLPVLKKHCFSCHGAEEKIRGEFVITNREDLIRGGESGEAVDLENPIESLLLSAINYESYEMPPSGQLPKKDIDNIAKWLMLGAPWRGAEIKPSRDSESSHGPPAVNAETKAWWSYNKPERSDVPVGDKSWSRNEIDRFISARLAKSNLKPNSPASKQTLVRRAYYDLLGLPPTPEQVQKFIDDESPDAFARLIDRLLASKHYGEKWGRHWLDLVRYAESNSYERDGTKPYVWRYRDYVIRSLNKDKPYDQFVIEQLAGDERQNPKAEEIIATGYYRLGKWDDEPVDRVQAWYDDMDDILATTGQAFLGMTINCARCHDHKIDPVPQADYYRMLAFFRNVQRYGVRGHDTVLRQSTQSIATPEQRRQFDEEVKRHKQAVTENQQAMAEFEKWVKQDFIPVEHEEFKHEMNRVPLVKKRIGKEVAGKVLTQGDAQKYAKLFRTMRKLRRELPRAMHLALSVTEKGAEAPPTHILIRGNSAAEGDRVEPGFPSVLSPPEPEIVRPANGKTTGRRLALAKWIASEDNPLTARVMANRIWQHHFGRGIVRSSNDFGFQGTAPTHPELLDWLALEFMDNGWSLKHLHRKMMNSATYQMSSAVRPEAVKIDPINNLMWRFEMRRLSAEEIRDSILAVNQSLNLSKMFGASIYPKIEKEVLQGQSRPGENWGNSSEEDINRRSIYIHIKRSLPVPLLQSFDVADPDTSCPVRFNTVQPTQALAMINSEFINEQAQKFANYLQENSPDDLPGQIEVALYQVLQRKPDRREIERGIEFVNRMNQRDGDRQDGLRLFCVVALNLNEFLYLD